VVAAAAAAEAVAATAATAAAADFLSSSPVRICKVNFSNVSTLDLIRSLWHDSSSAEAGYMI